MVIPKRFASFAETNTILHLKYSLSPKQTAVRPITALNAKANLPKLLLQKKLLSITLKQINHL